jgi:hypothetical protein
VAAPVGDVLRRYAGWLDHAAVCVVRFEDLIGERGGGDVERQIAAIQRIADHLDLDLSKERCRGIADRVFSTRTPTFRRGGSGGWKKHFKPVHLEAFAEQAGDLLERYGYASHADPGSSPSP